MPASYYKFNGFFPSIDKEEASELISILPGIGDTQDIFQLAACPPRKLAPHLDKAKLKDAYATSLQEQAGVVLPEITPVDPGNPTPEEQIAILGGLNRFYSAWPDAKQSALRSVIQRIADHNNLTDSYQILGKVTSMSLPEIQGFMDGETYDALARYYIVMAGRYIARDLKHYTVTGQVKGTEDAPMPEVQVRLEDHNVSIPRQSGATFTNDQGYFRSSFSSMEEDMTKYEIKVTFTHPRLNPSPQSESIDYESAQPNKIHSFALGFDPIPSSSKTVASTGTAIPADVQAYLNTQGITVTRLEDIRRLGGFINLPTDAIDKDDTNLLKLDGLANLELANADVSNNGTLYARGYTSISRVANTPRKDFVARNRDVLGDFGSAQVHARARAAHLYALNALADALAVQPAGEISKGIPIGPATGCGCPDCASTVSPLAYLADLLSFTLDNIDTVPGTAITLNYLRTNFFQDIGNLPASCAALNDTLCQNRIAAEVLRQYYATPAIGTTRTPRQLSDFATAVHEYLTGTYELLLNKLGTSYLELRRMRGIQDNDGRKRLSDRLGIVLNDGTSEDTIAQLFIDLSVPTNPTEAALEPLFGYRRTVPVTLTPTPESKVAQWKKARVQEIWREQDKPRNAYWQADTRKIILDPDIVTVDDLRTPEESAPAYIIWRRRREWVDNVIALLNRPEVKANTFRTDAVADKRLIIAFGTTSFVLPLDNRIHYSGSTFDKDLTVLKQYVIDGDTYFKVAEPLPNDSTNGTISTTTPVQSHSNADVGVLQADLLIALMCTDDAFPYGTAEVPAVWGTDSVADFITNLRQRYAAAIVGNATQQEAIIALGLSVPAAGRLLALYDKHKLAPLGPDATGNLSPEEWREFQDIMVAALKYYLSVTATIWKDEEAAINLGPQSFWAPAYAPKAGPWPILPGEDALLDPVMTTTDRLTEITARASADNRITMGSQTDVSGLDVLEARRSYLDGEITAMKDDFGTDPFEITLNKAFDETPGWSMPNYTGLLNELSDPVLSDCAIQIITERLQVTVDDFKFIMDVGARRVAGTVVPDGDLSRLWSILAEAFRRNGCTPSWKSEEEGVAQWKFRKAQLSVWRASLAERNAWLAALAENSAPPIIDADLLGPGDFRNSQDNNLDNNPAFSLWKQRWAEMHGSYDDDYPDDGNTGWLFDVDTYMLSSTSDFDALTKAHLDHAEGSLADIREQQEDGTDIRPRLAQLQLTATEFAQLLVLRDILPVPPQASADLLTGEEKTTIKRILAQVKKRRKAFAYRLEEVAPVAPAPMITLSPDFFRLPDVQDTTFPPAPEHPLIPWLAAERDLIAWRRTLGGRVEQQAATAKAWQEVLFEVEEAMMVNLRDALVQFCGRPDRTLVQNARAIGDKLLIDLENNCCYKTNRVAAAIETLQQLLWKTRTGDILASRPGMRYRGEDFDEAWTWMGSYANWRAAMFVFLYPENVLAPGLRKQQTPGFQAVMEATRSNRRFGPDDACQVARDYRDYLVDVADLELKCAAEAEVFVRRTGCGVQSTDKPRLLFSFAQARTSQNAYYCTVDARDKTDITQNSYWQRIPVLDETARIFGCSVFFPEDDGEFIYLFFTRTGTENRDKFFALRFNLLNGQWEEEPLEFQVDLDDLVIEWQNPASQYSNFRKEDFSPVIQAIAVRHCNDIGVLPTVAISLEKIAGISKDVYTFYWSMNPNGKEFKSRWKGDGWRLYIEGTKILKGLVRSFVGLYVNERSTMLDHSLLVLRTQRTTMVTSAWTSWNNGLQTLQNIASMDLHPFSTITFDGEKFPFFAISWIIYIWGQKEPQPKYETVEFTATDYLAYNQIFGGSTGGDTIYIPDQYASEAGKEIRFLLPFYDRSTFHLEVAQNGDRRQDVVTYSTADPNVPIVTNNEPLAASAFPEGRNLVAPVRHQRFFDPGNPDFEADGGLLLHQESGSGTRIGLSWHGKEFNDSTPELSTMQVTSAATVLTPGLSSVPVIQSEFTAAELDIRRLTSRYDLLQNTDPNFRLAEYVHEAYFFVPVQIALQLAANGYHQEALDWFRTVYDTSRPVAARKIYYGLVQDAQGTVPGPRAGDWYSDPLNPHAIAATRPFTYTRYIILAIAQCELSYADAQFTIDNAETVPRARELYEDAIALLGMLVPPDPCAADAATHQFEQEVRFGAWASTFRNAFTALGPLSGQPGFNDLVDDISGVLAEDTPFEDRLAGVQSLIATAQGQVEVRTFAQVMDDGRAAVDAYTAAALGSLEADTTAVALGGVSGRTFSRAVRDVTALPEGGLGTADLLWLVDDAAPLARSRANEVDRVNVGRTGTLIDHYDQHPASGLSLNSPYPNIRFSGLSFTFCTVPNPIVKALRLTAEVQLWKIHNCMNIAGMVRELDPFAAPTDSTTGIPVIGAGGTLSVPTDRQLPPSAYRYRVLVDRAKQLVGMSQQVESAFLATLEKLDAERYSVLRAEQDIESTKAQVKLQDLRMTEANDGVKLAELQRDRAQLQEDHYESLLSIGLLGMEIAALKEMQTAMSLLNVAAAASFAALFNPASFAGRASSVAQGFGTLASASSTQAGIFQLIASFQRRNEEWEFQKSLAAQDKKIADQGIVLAQDRVNIVGQERTIAALQNDHARATLDFLKNKFTSAELYEWMSGVLEDVYAYFLQAATGMALLAQRQLSFERQLDLPPFIRTDYWVVDAGSMGGVSYTGEGAVDRRGITGSTRLLRDLTELEQYAFSTNTPKLQMSKTISLNEIAPEELIRLRDQGVMAFRTTHEQFDRDYPGHYLRLIKKVSVTVIALNPPTKGIRATLTNGGVSRVITGGTIFQERVINRLPEQIALSGGVNDAGVFQLRSEGEFLDPFEGTGVDTQWEFRMEKAANPFDFDSIADVLLTIEYEALNSFTYRQTVIQRLDNEPTSAGLAISFKNNLPDQWFDLHNPDQAAARFTATFNISPRDLMPNVQQPHTIDHVAVYFAMKEEEQFDQFVTLKFEDSADCEARPNGNLISTRSNAQGFTGLQGMAGPEGTWTFKLEDSARTASLIADKKVDDILLVITYSGQPAHYSN